MNKLAFIILVLLTILSMGASYYSLYHSNHRTAYVYIEKVYDGFKGKAEIEKELKNIENKQRNILDTLKLGIINLQNKMGSANARDKQILEQQADIRRKQYSKLLQEFSAYNSKESEKHVEGLLKEINGYIKLYGEKNNYEYIFGAAGNGSLMYAREGNDITGEVIKYINKKYEGD